MHQKAFQVCVAQNRLELAKIGSKSAKIGSKLAKIGSKLAHIG